MRRSNSAMIRASKADRWPLATRSGEGWWRPRATRRDSSGCARPCRRSRRCASARTWSLSPRFDVYKAVSAQIHEIFADYTPLIEPLSLDEAYLDVTDNLRGIATASANAREIRSRILEETGLTASAGISYCKFVAKLASDFRKPNGQYVVPPEMGPAFVEALPVTKFYGVGPVTAAKMHKLGIQTGADLKAQTLEFLQRHFGKSGPWYYEIARGRDERPVRPDRERKSSGSETTFSEDLIDPEKIEVGVLAMADDVWAWCEKTGRRARTVTVKIKWADFQQSTRSQSFPWLVDSKAKIHEASLGLIRSVFPPARGIRLVGVTLSNFAPMAANLTDEPSLLNESDAA
jgi:DNA polymerase IV